MPEAIAYIEAERDRVRPGASFDIGVITEMLHLGDADWELPKHTRTGSTDRIVDALNEYGAMGVSHLQLRFAARSADELCDQIAAFGAEVGPHLTR